MQVHTTKPDGTSLDAATLERVCAERLEELAIEMRTVAVRISSATAAGDDKTVADAAAHLQELVELRKVVRKASRLLTIDTENKLRKVMGAVQEAPARRTPAPGPTAAEVNSFFRDVLNREIPETRESGRGVFPLLRPGYTVRNEVGNLLPFQASREDFIAAWLYFGARWESKIVP